MGYAVSRDNDMIVTNNEARYMCLTMVLVYFTFHSSIVAASSVLYIRLGLIHCACGLRKLRAMHGFCLTGVVEHVNNHNPRQPRHNDITLIAIDKPIVPTFWELSHAAVLIATAYLTFISAALYFISISFVAVFLYRLHSLLKSLDTHLF